MVTFDSILSSSRSGDGQSLDGPAASGDASPLWLSNGLEELGPPGLPAKAGPGSSVDFRAIALPAEGQDAQAGIDIRGLSATPGRPGLGVTVGSEQVQMGRLGSAEGLR